MPAFPLLTVMVLQVFLLALPALSAQAQMNPFDEFWYRVIQGKVIITNYTRKTNTGIVEVPAMLEGKPVTEIGTNAFHFCRELTGIVLPPGITTIGSSAFSGCNQLRTVTIPSSVTTIGSGAFFNCLALTGVDLPAGLTKIGSYTFLSCRSLTSLTIPETVTSIETRAFNGCGLTSLSLPGGLTTIGPGAFDYCKSLTSVTIPASVTSLGGGTPFNHCTSMQSILVEPESSGFRSVNGVLFNAGQTQLIQYPAGREGAYSVPEGVSGISGFAFVESKKLTEISFPDSLISLGDRSFSSCTGLTDLTLPPGLETIGAGAFSYCTGLTGVTLPAGLTSLGEAPFLACSGLLSLQVDEGNTSIASADGVIFSRDLTALLQYPGGKPGPYALPEGTVTVKAQAFSNAERLSAVTFPASLTTLENAAFLRCTGLSGVTLHSGITTIANETFSGCSGLTMIALPSGMRSVPASCFLNCSGLAQVDFPSTLQSVSNAAFAGCVGIREVIFPPALDTLEKSAFTGCTALKTISFSDGPVRIGDGAFSRCSGLTLINFPTGGCQLENRAFTDCRGLRSLTFHSGSVELGGSVFSGCSGLRRITVSNADLTFISGGNFAGCPNLTGWVFLGAAPSAFPSFSSSDFASNFRYYYLDGQPGFTSPLWKGFPAIALGQVPQSPDEWAAEQGLAPDADLTEDRNGDGVSLLMAYALELDPAADLSGRLPAPAYTATSVSLKFPVTRPEVSYVAETSTDLGDWTTEGVTQSAPDAEGRVTATVSRDGTNRFLRLRVAL